MNDPEVDVFENELSKLKPARAPMELVSKLIAAGPAMPLRKRPASEHGEKMTVLWRRLLWVLAPSVAALVVAAAVLFASRLGQKPTLAARPVPVEANASGQQSPDATVAEPDEQLEIDRYLVASFETVAESPDSGPVRLRFDQWLETVTFRDPDTGIAIERRIPRLQVVPVRLESY